MSFAYRILTLLRQTHKTLVVYSRSKFIIHGFKTNARGVTIIIKNTIEYSIKKTEGDSLGNLLFIDLQLTNFTMRIINIYAPK